MALIPALSGGDKSVDVTNYVARQNSEAAQGGTITVPVTKKPRLVISYFLLSGSTYFRSDIWDTSTDNVLSIQKPASSNIISYQVLSNSSLGEFSLGTGSAYVTNIASGQRIMGAMVIY